MRTTIRLDDALLSHAKMVAAETGTTLTAVIEDSLRQAFARRETAKKQPPVCLTVVNGNGLHPGVDLDDSASLLELMEQENVPA